MAKLLVGTKNIGGIFRVSEDVELAEQVKVDGKWTTGKTFAYIRHIPEYSGEGDGGEFFELEVPSWDYDNNTFMIIVKQKEKA
jgi:hypothetical protein